MENISQLKTSDEELKKRLLDFEISVASPRTAWFCKQCGNISHLQTEGRMERKQFCDNCFISTWHKRIEQHETSN